MRKVSFNIQMILGSLLLLILIGFAFYLIGLVYPSIKGNSLISLLIVLVELGLVGIGILVFKMYLNFIKGDMGESDVNYILDKLEIENKEYSHLHDVMIRENKGNIDSVVIGPTGVWSIEVKNQTERVIIHDKYLDKDINQAYAESKELEKFLSAKGFNSPVTPVLVFANKRTRMNFGMRPINGVYVIGKKWLPELLIKHSNGYLSPEQCLQIKGFFNPYASKIS